MTMPHQFDFAGPEILAPAGGRESLEAAVRAGADAVYLGGKSLNARRGAANFDDAQLADAIAWCHVRGAKVYQTVNTIVFPRELEELAQALETACRLGVDGLIIQDLAVWRLARTHMPDLPLHASTQMAVHNLDGVKQLEQMGFQRVVLARELSLEEIAHIAAHSPLELEVFVHGALCMCVSGQCYLSSMIGGRSGNRGLCAQPCRLPFASGTTSHALSLKDLSAVRRIRELAAAGVTSLKIEGRLKRPEYVAAAVHACTQARAGETPDMEALRAVFSRSGFTNGYLENARGDAMFGTRQKEDVVSGSGVYKELQRLYAHERQSVPVTMAFSLHREEPCRLTVTDGDGNTAAIAGAIPQQAMNKPTTRERAAQALEKTGGTPYRVSAIAWDMEDGLIVPASELNRLRREGLEALTALRGAANPTPFHSAPLPEQPTSHPASTRPEWRIRVGRAAQLTEELFRQAAYVQIPLRLLAEADRELLSAYAAKVVLEPDRLCFQPAPPWKREWQLAEELGITHMAVGNLGWMQAGRQRGLQMHGDYSLNIANPAALAAYGELGLTDATLSFELSLENAMACRGAIPTGLLVYGSLPLMATRNAPAGIRGKGGSLTDRLGNRFPVTRAGDVWELSNMTPLYLADKLEDFRDFDFLTLYFTDETPEQCAEILRQYQTGAATEQPKTRGLYYRRVQ
ncbi:U32 family peptidase [Ruminococcaceae bacterium OttesenSCG-928-L11]|nr:U32 family peptidase [Ruminococcaceae bacterium OttesenSCG-928-L11]